MAWKLRASSSSHCSPAAGTAKGTATTPKVWPPSPSPHWQAKSGASHPGLNTMHASMQTEQRSPEDKLDLGSCRKGKFGLKHTSEKQHGSTAPGLVNFQFQRCGLPLTFIVKLGQSHRTSPRHCWEAVEKPQCPAQNQAHKCKQIKQIVSLLSSATLGSRQG